MEERKRVVGIILPAAFFYIKKSKNNEIKIDICYNKSKIK